MIGTIWKSLELYSSEERKEIYETVWDCSGGDFSQDDIEYENDIYLGYAQEDLNVEVKNGIIRYAYLGLWDGVHIAIDPDFEATNISECLTFNHDYAEIFMNEDNDLQVNDYHHDGINKVIYRAWKGNISESKKSKLFNNFFINYDIYPILQATRSLGTEIKKAYSWK